MKAIYRNFGHPRGVLGWLVGHAMARKNRERSEWAVGLLAPQPGEHVLEVGFGPGTDVARLAAAVGPAGFVAGVDPSREMLRQATARNRRAIRDGRVRLESAGAESLPFDDASFDAVYSVNTAFFWPDLAAGTREIARVLRAPGRALVALQPLWKGATAADAESWCLRLECAMRDAGLEARSSTLAHLSSGDAVGATGNR